MSAMIQLKRSTFINGCWGTAGLATANLARVLGAPDAFHFDPLTAAWAVFMAVSVGLNLAVATAWAAARLDAHDPRRRP
jgi:hypothetical protein